MARKKVKLKKDQYECVGGPLQKLYLPHPREDADPLDHLPREVPMDDGMYLRGSDYGADGKLTVHYKWKENRR